MSVRGGRQRIRGGRGQRAGGTQGYSSRARDGGEVHPIPSGYAGHGAHPAMCMVASSIVGGARADVGVVGRVDPCSTIV